MCLHIEASGAIVQTNVEQITGNFENIGTVESSNVTELWELAVVEEILKLEAFNPFKAEAVIM